MGQIFSIFDIFDKSCKFEEDNDDDGLLIYYHIPSSSEKSLERVRSIENQIYKNKI